MGAGGVKNFSVEICDGAPSTAHSSSDLFSHTWYNKNGIGNFVFNGVAGQTLYKMMCFCP